LTFNLTLSPTATLLADMKPISPDPEPAPDKTRGANRLRHFPFQAAGILVFSFAAAAVFPAAAAGNVVARGNTATQVSVGGDGKINVIPAAAQSGVS
jgi:hypothetical protein